MWVYGYSCQYLWRPSGPRCIEYIQRMVGGQRGTVMWPSSGHLFIPVQAQLATHRYPFLKYKEKWRWHTVFTRSNVPGSTPRYKSHGSECTLKKGNCVKNGCNPSTFNPTLEFKLINCTSNHVTTVRLKIHSSILKRRKHKNCAVIQVFMDLTACCMQPNIFCHLFWFFHICEDNAIHLLGDSLLLLTVEVQPLLMTRFTIAAGWDSHSRSSRSYLPVIYLSQSVT